MSDLVPSPHFRDPRDGDAVARGAGVPFKPGEGGRKKISLSQKYYNEFKRGCPPERFAKVVAKVVALAEEGDMKAAKLIFDRALPERRLEDLMRGVAGSGGQVQIMVVQADDLQARKDRLRQAVVR